MLHAVDVTFAYPVRSPGDGATEALRDGRPAVLHNVSAEIRRGDVVGILGPNGSGKSTLLNILGCLDRPTEGRYRLNGQDVGRLSADQLAEVRNREIGFVFQNFNLIPRTSALENAQLPLFYRGLALREQRAKAAAVLKRVGLEGREQHFPTQLSGGQQQRVAIARALVHNPRLVVCDEPTAALDAQSGQDVLTLLRHTAVQPDRGVIVVTHDERIFRFADRIVRMEDGRIVRIEANAPAGAAREAA